MLGIFSQALSGAAEDLINTANKANICLSMASPLAGLVPKLKSDDSGGKGPAETIIANEQTARIVEQTAGLRQWVIIDPRKCETYDQAEQMLTLSKCVGIKIHPEEHKYPIKEYGKAIFEFAAEHKAIVLTHSGEKSSMPEDFSIFANEFPEMTLIIAHLGWGWDSDPTHHVQAIQNSKHGNLFVDTSSSMSITTKLIEWAVGEIGAEKILFGSDSLLYFAPMQRARIDHAYISNENKKMILRDNAIKLFNLTELEK